MYVVQAAIASLTWSPSATGRRSRLGRAGEARDACRQALALVHDDAERRLFERRLAALGAVAGPDGPEGQAGASAQARG